MFESSEESLVRRLISECARKPYFFPLNHFFYPIPRVDQLRIRILHEVTNCENHFVEKRFLLPSNRPCTIARLIILRST